MISYATTDETLGYVTAEDDTNTKNAFLVAGSKNVLIDQQRKVRSRPGYSRLGAANSALTPIRNAWTWHTSTGQEWAQRFYDDELEVYLTEIDGTTINSWTRVSSGWSSTEKLRQSTWFDTGENIDLQLMVQGDANIYEWNGAIAVVDSVPTANTVTKTGTTTFAQNRFYTTRNKTFVCVRTGTEYTYTGGESSTTLTGIADTTGLVAGDILVQKIVTQSNKPAANHTNHIIYTFENQVCIGSKDDEEIWISKNSSYYDFSYSAPRLSGEGGLLTLDAPTSAIASIGKILIAFCGTSSAFQAEYEQISVGSTLAETLKVKKLDAGVNQAAINQECVLPLTNSLAYLSHEPALRIISNPTDINGISPKTFSNPIKPDFDAEDFTDAFMFWHKNDIHIAAPATSRQYILSFREDANGRAMRFWNPPQVRPIAAYSVIDESLHGHSNAVPETYLLNDGLSDVNSDDEKLPIDCQAWFAYNDYGKRGVLKSFDEYYVEGEITQSTTDLSLTLKYDYGGETQTLTQTIDGSDEDILEGNVGVNSLAQTSLGDTQLGGLLLPPSDARKFTVIFEIAKEDFRKIQPVFSTNEVDRYWAILSHGCNATLSPRRDNIIRK